jgi:hypothetical protein
MPQERDYDNIVMKLFLAGAIITLLLYPLFGPRFLQRPVALTVAMILLAVWGGLRKPERHWTVVVVSMEAAVSLFSILLFETNSLTFVGSPLTWPFLACQVLALIFIIAFCLSVRTLYQMCGATAIAQ